MFVFSTACAKPSFFVEITYTKRQRAAVTMKPRVFRDSGSLGGAIGERASRTRLELMTMPLRNPKLAVRQLEHPVRRTEQGGLAFTSLAALGCDSGAGADDTAGSSSDPIAIVADRRV